MMFYNFRKFVFTLALEIQKIFLGRMLITSPQDIR